MYYGLTVTNIQGGIMAVFIVLSILIVGITAEIVFYHINKYTEGTHDNYKD